MSKHRTPQTAHRFAIALLAADLVFSGSPVGREGRGRRLEDERLVIRPQGPLNLRQVACRCVGDDPSLLSSFDAAVSLQCNYATARSRVIRPRNRLTTPDFCDL